MFPIRTHEHLLAWRTGAAEQFDDPSEPVCQMFFRWIERHVPHVPHSNDDLRCCMAEGALVLFLEPDRMWPIPLERPLTAKPVLQGGQLISYGLEQITADVWALAPSLNIEGLVHGFVTLYGVPSPAPFERLILLPGDA